jgi:5-methylcytosine-specific restriction endonuclease McrA
MYCGCQPGAKNLTIDHVVPRCKGGKTDWYNVVAACQKCNSRKGDKEPYDARMVLKRDPYKPDMSSYIRLTINLPKTPEGWANYLSYSTLLE